MTLKTKDSLYLIPPAGPISWLYPELYSSMVVLASRCRSDSAIKREDILDLTRAGFTGQQIVDAITAREPDLVTVENGPRGHSLCSWLRQAMRRSSINVEVPDLMPPEITGRVVSKPFPGWPLESLLVEASRHMTSRGMVLVDFGKGDQPLLKEVPLSAEETGSPGFQKVGKSEHLLLLPLVPDGELESRLEEVISVVAQNPSFFRKSGLVPYFVTQAPSRTARTDNLTSVETRLPVTWWGLLPGDVYPASVRHRFRDLIRLLYPDRIFLFLTFENYGLAGIDLYTETLMDRFGDVLHKREVAKKHEEPLTKEGDRCPLILGVCGTDGSGKSSHVNELVNYFTGLGLRVKKHKIYRHGIFHDTVTDLTRKCAGGHNLHLWRLQRLIKVFDSVKYFYSAVERDLDSSDVVIFDRYVFTHFAAGIGRYHHDPFTMEMLAIYPQADRIYFLDLPVEEALRRIGVREERTVDENPYMLSRYGHALRDLGDKHGFMVLDALKPFEENRQLVLNDATRLAKARGLLR